MIPKYITLGDLLKRFEPKLSIICIELSGLAGATDAFSFLYRDAPENKKPKLLTIPLDKIQPLIELIDTIIVECVKAELTNSVMGAIRLKNDLAQNSLNAITFHEKVGELTRRIEDELQSVMLYSVSPNKQKYITGKDLFGDTVSKSFPSTKNNIEEAGKCLAFERGSACIFHLMKVLEVGLYSMANDLNITNLQENWGNAIEQIEKALREFEKTKPEKTDTQQIQDEWKSKNQFYKDSATHFYYIKDAWRNYNTHARQEPFSYSDEKTQQIFDNVCGFMQTLATRIQEKLPE